MCGWAEEQARSPLREELCHEIHLPPHAMGPCSADAKLGMSHLLGAWVPAGRALGYSSLRPTATAQENALLARFRG